MNFLPSGIANEGFVLPNEVLKRFGGLTSIQKQDLYNTYHSLGFVWIPEYLKSVITGVESLVKYGVCKSPPDSPYLPKPYFVCPDVQSSVTGLLEEEEKRFCCGPPSHQSCCRLSTFSTGIRVVRSALSLSPSAIIGLGLTFFLLSLWITIVVYARIARSLRVQSSSMKQSSRCSLSRFPPRKHLLSSRGSDTCSYAKSSSRDELTGFSSLSKYPQDNHYRSSNFTTTASENPLALRALGINYGLDLPTTVNTSVQAARKMDYRRAYKGGPRD